jgi:hypothetical protein
MILVWFWFRSSLEGLAAKVKTTTLGAGYLSEFFQLLSTTTPEPGCGAGRA